MSANTDQTIPLSSVPASANPKLKVKFDLSASGGTPQSTPLVKQLRVTYASAKIGADTDGDGVPDTTDECPTQAGSAATGGCPDTDGDGIRDSLDACPTVAAPGTPDGCPPPPPPPPPDGDADGIPDAQDACPTVAGPGTPNGCPLGLTITASKTKIVYGGSVTLSGTLLYGTLPATGQMVTVLAQPVGAAAPTQLGTVVTDIAGKWTMVVTPKRHTNYNVVLTGVTSPVAVLVKVAHKLTLKVAGKGAKRTFTGKISPKHAKRLVVIQIKKGKRFVTFAKVKTGKRSTFKIVKAVKQHTRLQFRATTKADIQHLAGLSKVVKVRT
jgi:hypothetical protein